MQIHRLVAPLLLLFCIPLNGATFRGVVVDGDGAPLSAATVSAYAPETTAARAARMRSASPDRKAVISTTSSASGEFNFDFDANWLDVAVARQGYDPSFRAFAADELNVVELERSDIRTGHVKSGGKAVENALVVVRGDAGEIQSRTNARGEFQLPGSSDTLTSIEVYAPGRAPFTSPIDGETEEVPLDIELASGRRWRGTVVNTSGSPAAGATLWAGNVIVGTTGEGGEFDLMLDASSSPRLVAATSDSIALLSPSSADGRVALMRPVIVSGVVRDASGRPLSSVRVRALSESFMRDVFTDAKGSYRLELPPDQYQLWADRPGYAIRAEESSSYMLDLRAGRSTTRNLTMTAFASIRGRVLDEAKKGVSGVVVAMFPNYMRVAPAITSTDGSFRLGLNADLVRAAQAGGLKFLFVARKPGYAAAERALDAETAKGELTFLLTAGVLLEGKVADEKDQPVAGALVSLRPKKSSNVVEPLIETASSDAVGHFSVRLREGAYVVTAEAEGFQRSSGSAVDVRREPSSRPLVVRLARGVAAAGRIVHADGSAVSGASVMARGDDDLYEETKSDAAGAFHFDTLKPGTYIVSAYESGQSISESISATFPKRDVLITVRKGQKVIGRVIDAVTRRPVSAFQLFAELDSGEQSSEPMQVNDAEGRFTIPRLSVGTWTLDVRTEGYVPYRLRDLVIGEEPPSPLEIALDSGTSLHGVVRDESSGAPLENVQVFVDGSEEETYYDATTTNSSGEYTIAGLPRKKLRVQFTKDGWAPRNERPDLAEVSALDVRLSAGLRLRGVVTSGGKPVSDAAVLARSTGVDGGMSTARTDAAGRFTISGLLAGRVSVMASKQGFARAELNDVEAGSSDELQLELRRMERGTIRGRVVGVDISQYSNRSVLANSDAGSQSAEVDEDGAFVMEDAPAGEVTIAARLAGRGTTASSRGRW